MCFMVSFPFSYLISAACFLVAFLICSCTVSFFSISCNNIVVSAYLSRTSFNLESYVSLSAISSSSYLGMVDSNIRLTCSTPSFIYYIDISYSLCVKLYFLVSFISGYDSTISTVIVSLSLVMTFNVPPFKV